MGISVSPCKRSASSIVLSVPNSTFIVAHSRTVPCTATWCKDYFHCIKMDMERNTVQSNKRILSYAWVLSVLLPSKNVTSPFLRDLGVWSLDHGCTETFFLYKVVMLREQHIFCQDYSCKITVEGHVSSLKIITLWMRTIHQVVVGFRVWQPIYLGNIEHTSIWDEQSVFRFWYIEVLKGLAIRIIIIKSLLSPLPKKQHQYHTYPM